LGGCVRKAVLVAVTLWSFAVVGSVSAASRETWFGQEKYPWWQGIQWSAVPRDFHVGRAHTSDIAPGTKFGRVVWQREFTNTAAVVHDTVLYTVQEPIFHKGTRIVVKPAVVVALNTNDGTTSWEHTFGAADSGAPHSESFSKDNVHIGFVNNNVVFSVNPHSGRYQCLNTASGCSVAQGELSRGWPRVLVTSGSLIIVYSAEPGCLVAFDLNTRRETWMLPAGRLAYPPVQWMNFLLLPQNDKLLWIDMRTGVVSHEHRFLAYSWRTKSVGTSGGGVRVACVTDEGRCYVGLEDGTIRAVDLATREERILRELHPTYRPYQMAVFKNKLFTIGQYERFECTALEDGRGLWSAPCGCGAPIVPTSTAIFVLEYESVRAFSPNDGSLLSQFQFSEKRTFSKQELFVLRDKAIVRRCNVIIAISLTR